MNTTPLQPTTTWWKERWIATSGSSETTLDVETDELPKRLGSVAGMERDLGQGLNLYVLAAQLHEPVSAVFTSPEPYFWLAVTQAGNSSYENGARITGDIAAGNTYCSLHREDESIVSYAPGIHSAGGLAITKERLGQILGGQFVDGPIQTFLSGQFDPMLKRVTTMPETNTILEQLISHPYQGAMEAVYLEAKAYELLVQGLRLMAEFGGNDTITSARRVARQAREFMMADVSRPPGIGEVAKHVGLSQRSLSKVFQEVYGASPLRCLTMWRLEAARSFLRSGELSVKQVAHLLGYNHPSNFSQAFTRQFGTAPTLFHDD